MSRYTWRSSKEIGTIKHFSPNLKNGKNVEGNISVCVCAKEKSNEYNVAMPLFHVLQKKMSLYFYAIYIVNKDIDNKAKRNVPF